MLDMEMHETILEMAARMIGVLADDPLLEELCQTAESLWAARLHYAVTPKTCPVFCRAAALTAAGCYMGGRPATYRVGDVEVRGMEGGDVFRDMAKAIMAPYLSPDREVAFLGVRA